jgi:hypothetical protein
VLSHQILLISADANLHSTFWGNMTINSSQV